MNKTKWIAPLLISLCCLIFLGSVGFYITRVDGDSMENTIYSDSYIIINKLAYRFSKPKRFDVIVFPYDEKNDVYYVKRVIGLPGETLQIRNNSIYINGKLLRESYGKESMDEYSEGIAYNKIVLKEDEYFVLGDNRNNSFDSRDKEVGFIKEQNILGKAFFCIFPLSEIAFIRG